MSVKFLEEILSSSPVFVIGSYVDLGIVVYDGAILRLFTGWSVDSSNQSTHSVLINLIPEPQIVNAAITSVLVNSIGSRIALIGASCAFVIEVPAEVCGFFDEKSDFFEATYYCRCRNLAKTFSSVRGPNIMKCRWYWKQSNDDITASGRLAILCADNVIRIFDTSLDDDCPTVQINFSLVSHPHKFGFLNYIVSFDFGPCIVVEEGSNDAVTQKSTIFAVDSENGDVYAAIFDFESTSQKILGPLEFLSHCDSLSDATDLINVRTDFMDSCHLFSISFAKGIFLHFIPIMKNNDRITICLDTHDLFAVPHSSQAINGFTLERVARDTGTYVAYDATNVYSVQVDVEDLVRSDISEFDESTSADFDSLSRIEHIFCAVSTSEFRISSSFASFAISTDDCKIGEGKFPTSRTRNLITVFLAGDEIFTRTTRIQTFEQKYFPIDSTDRVKLERKLKTTKVPFQKIFDDIMSNQISVPKIKFCDPSDLSNSYETFLILSSALSHNLNLFKQTQEIVKQRMLETVDDFKTLHEEKNKCYEKLLFLITEYSLIKNRLEHLRKNMLTLSAKVEKLAALSVRTAAPLTNAETALKERLENMKSELKEIATELPYVNNQVLVLRRERFGCPKSFCASVGARKFVLSKNTNDIEKLKAWLERIGRNFSELQISTEKARKETKCLKDVRPAIS